MPSGMLTMIHGASRRSPKRGLGEQLIMSSQLLYCITSDEQLVLAREPTASIGVQCTHRSISCLPCARLRAVLDRL